MLVSSYSLLYAQPLKLRLILLNIKSSSPSYSPLCLHVPIGFPQSAIHQSHLLFIEPKQLWEEWVIGEENNLQPDKTMCSKSSFCHNNQHVLKIIIIMCIAFNHLQHAFIYNNNNNPKGQDNLPPLCRSANCCSERPISGEQRSNCTFDLIHTQLRYLPASPSVPLFCS